MAQADPQREAKVKAIEERFKKFDKEGKGLVPMSNFGAFLKEDGFSFEPRLVKNLENVVDFYASGQLAFPIYLWLHDLLTSARDAFNANAKDGSAPVSSLDNIMTKLGYKFAPQTMKLLQAFVDREKKGSFTFEKLAYLLAFIQFTLNHFNEADTDQSKTLEYNEVKENLKWLGLDKASDAEVQALFKKYDLDGNNHLEFEEFVGMAISLKFPELAK